MIKYSILLSLSKLSNKLKARGFVQASEKIDEILYKLIDDLEKDENIEDQETDDLSAIINSVGLRGDTKPEQPMGGLTLEPFFFDGGDLRY